MLTSTQMKAVDLVFQVTDEEAARKLKIKKETIEAWMRDPEFAQAIREEMKSNRQAAVRKLSRLYLDACRELEAALNAEDGKDKAKVAIEILKASGLFKDEIEEDDPIAGLISELSDDE
jgi:hypothetical protein